MSHNPLNCVHGQTPISSLTELQGQALRVELANAMLEQMAREGWAADTDQYHDCLDVLGSVDAGGTVLECLTAACVRVGISVPSCTVLS